MSTIIQDICSKKGVIMKIAVPLDSDKESIFKRTGQAPFFGIYQDGELTTIIDNSHGHESHDHHEHSQDHEAHTQHHRKDIAGLAECDWIIVQLVGEHMQEALSSFDIKIKKVRQKDGTNAHELVTNFIQQQESK